jgi:hypothetical protein
MSHQDSKDVRISCENLKAVFGLLLPSSAVNCRRHGNAEKGSLPIELLVHCERLPTVQ